MASNRDDRDPNRGVGQDAETRILDSPQDNVKTRNLGVEPQTTVGGGQMPPAATIGDYRILRKIGEGGVGVVYEAEQQSPHRLVALKVIRGGLHTDNYHVKMFEREIEALARLKHPGIASIYESGRTEDGTVFFAVELVNGVPLDDFVEKRRSLDGDPARDVKSHLALFSQIGDVVSHAHQRGVIHRDLKPQNILVTDDADLGSLSGERVGVKILDFGLARINDPDFRGNTGVSQVGQIKGTLLYMSPEQVRGRSDDIDVRSDVYALGVMLYEMISGQMPYDLAGVSLPEAMRIICEEPPKPLAKALTETHGRSARIDRDVETIALKALEKDPDRRYQSVAAMLDDVERYLRNEPILARPPSPVYQFRKLVERHKVAFASLAVIFLLTAGFGVVMAAQSVRIARERDKAEEARAEADKQRSDAEIARNDALAARNEEAKQRQIAVDNLTRAEDEQKRAEDEKARAQDAQRAEERQRLMAQANLLEAQNQKANAERQTSIAKEQTNLAERKTLEANNQRTIAETEAERTRALLYAAQITMAQQAWQEGNVSRAEELLNNQIPTSGQVDPRSFEWYYLWFLCNRDLAGFTFTGEIADVKFTEDGKSLLVYTTDMDETDDKPLISGQMNILDPVSGKQMGTVPVGNLQILAVAKNNFKIAMSDREPLAGPKANATVSVLDIRTKQVISTSIPYTFNSHYSFSADGKLLAAALYPWGLNATPVIEVWDTSLGEKIMSLKGERSGYRDPRFSPDNTYIAATSILGGPGSRLTVWDIRTGTELYRKENEKSEEFSAVAFSPDSQILATTGRDGAIRLWESGSGREVAEISKPNNSVGYVFDTAFSPDGRNLAAANTGGVRLFDLASKTEMPMIKGHSGWVRFVSFSPDGKKILTASDDRTVKLWILPSRADFEVLIDQSGGAIRTADGTMPKRTSDVRSPDGSKRAIATVDTLRIIDTTSLFDLALPIPFGALWVDLKFSPDSKLLFAAYFGGIALINTTTGRLVFHERNIRRFSEVTQSAFSPDGKTLAYRVGADVVLWSTEFEKHLPPLKMPRSAISDMTFSRDGRRLATLDRNLRRIRIWDIPTRQPLIELPALHPGVSTIGNLSFTPDGRALIATPSSLGRTTFIWRGATDEEVARKRRQ